MTDIHQLAQQLDEIYQASFQSWLTSQVNADRMTQGQLRTKFVNYLNPALRWQFRNQAWCPQFDLKFLNGVYEPVLILEQWEEPIPEVPILSPRPFNQDSDLDSTEELPSDGDEEDWIPNFNLLATDEPL